MAEQHPKTTKPAAREQMPDRRRFATTADWWEALTGAQRRDYIEREGCPPVGAIRAWNGPQDPGFGNG